jgi:hypothetical protein
MARTVLLITDPLTAAGVQKVEAGAEAVLLTAG